MDLRVADQLVKASRPLIVLRLINVLISERLSLMAHRQTVTLVEGVLLRCTNVCSARSTVNVEVTSALLLTLDLSSEMLLTVLDELLLLVAR